MLVIIIVSFLPSKNQDSILDKIVLNVLKKIELNLKFIIGFIEEVTKDNIVGQTQIYLLARL